MVNKVERRIVNSLFSILKLDLIISKINKI